MQARFSAQCADRLAAQLANATYEQSFSQMESDLKKLLEHAETLKIDASKQASCL